MGFDKNKRTDEKMTKKRPIERQKMRPWLQDMLENGGVQGLEWFDKPKDQFKINWKHGSRHGFNTRKDASLFEKYAQHTGRWDPDDPNPKKWKANFRCALNSLQNVMEIKQLGESKGAHAYRVYQFLPEEETKPKDDHRKTNKKKTEKTKCRRNYKSEDTTDEESEKEVILEMIPAEELKSEELSSTWVSEEAPPSTPVSPKPLVHEFTYKYHMAGCIVRQIPRKRPAEQSLPRDDNEDLAEMTQSEAQPVQQTRKRRRLSNCDDESMTSYSQLSVTDESSNISSSSDSCLSTPSSPGEGTDNLPNFANFSPYILDKDWVVESEETVTTTQ
ncbi:interferon regulatory factor 2-like isoform X2 [Saccostrea cucullata]|uniref:interferon regulatory factor 2-like isoform X2 n=1 Tax=Saccostrea cuccullata TaxID=36930 RepID=UPI002ED1315B